MFISQVLNSKWNGWRLNCIRGGKMNCKYGVDMRKEFKEDFLRITRPERKPFRRSDLNCGEKQITRKKEKEKEDCDSFPSAVNPDSKNCLDLLQGKNACFNLLSCYFLRMVLSILSRSKHTRQHTHTQVGLMVGLMRRSLPSSLSSAALRFLSSVTLKCSQRHLWGAKSYPRYSWTSITNYTRPRGNLWS